MRTRTKYRNARVRYNKHRRTKHCSLTGDERVAHFRRRRNATRKYRTRRKAWETSKQRIARLEKRVLADRARRARRTRKEHQRVKQRDAARYLRRRVARRAVHRAGRTWCKNALPATTRVCSARRASCASPAPSVCRSQRRASRVTSRVVTRPSTPHAARDLLSPSLAPSVWPSTRASLLHEARTELREFGFTLDSDFDDTIEEVTQETRRGTTDQSMWKSCARSIAQ